MLWQQIMAPCFRKKSKKVALRWLQLLRRHLQRKPCIGRVLYFGSQI